MNLALTFKATASDLKTTKTKYPWVSNKESLWKTLQIELSEGVHFCLH